MISIITAYYNRKELFKETLKSIIKTKHDNFEFIVVDDGSSPEHRLEDLIKEYPFLKIIRLEKKNKWYINPCVPFNVGIRKAKGDILILQNPECLHVHDVLTYIQENIDDDKYISLSAYGLDPETTKILPQFNESNTVDHLLKTLPQRGYSGGSMGGWYNHSLFRPVHFHFCSAITKNNMNKLNGFDERFANGIGYDDDEIIYRIKLIGLEMIIEDNISVMHQYHDTLWTDPNTGALCEKNRMILMNKTRQENKHYVNR